MHGGVVIGDIEDVDWEAGGEIREGVVEAAFVGGLHDEDDIRPMEEFFGDAAAGGGGDAGAEGFDAGVVPVDGLSSGAAPVVAGAEEEEADGSGHGSRRTLFLDRIDGILRGFTGLGAWMG